MSEEINYELLRDDYAQSANSLFHFVKEPKFLKDILHKKALVPRYCKENIEYLKVHNNGFPFNEVLILQKCFCDIPFHKLTENFQLRGVGENYEKLTNEERAFLSKNNSHPDFYGEYAIAFSKSWGEKKNLQPVHYLNELSQYTRDFSEMIGYILNEENVQDMYVNDILNRLSFVKPLRGIMKRKIQRDKGDELEVEFFKNFYDEQEWRFVPDIEALAKAEVDPIIANPNVLKMGENGIDISDRLINDKYNALWLKYGYDDIRYIIVPNANERIDFIQTILSIEDDNFSNKSDILTQKHVLISKIIVLEEIRKDW